jgi:DNA invertase Pin-like site-specific DNA recombinase
MGALVVAEFVERGRSGRSIERPELRRVLEYIQDRPVGFVIVYKIDRLARNHTDDVVITKTIQKRSTKQLAVAEENFSEVAAQESRLAAYVLLRETPGDHTVGLAK